MSQDLLFRFSTFLFDELCELELHVFKLLGVLLLLRLETVTEVIDCRSQRFNLLGDGAEAWGYFFGKLGLNSDRRDVCKSESTTSKFQ